jgi:hypothetical protein
VFGNRITNAAGVDQFIAGLVYLSQDSLRSLTGFVTSIDPTTGQFTLAGGFKGQAGAAAGGIGGITCVINDPLGVYYAGPTKYTANPLWSVDPANPSIRSATGYPMCIPGPALASGKEDPNCPSKNRPKNTKGVYLTSL